MSDFPDLFVSAIEKHCVGKALIRVEAEGTFETQREHWLHLDDGSRVTFLTGSSGIDSDTRYELKIFDAAGAELVSLTRYPPGSSDPIHPTLSVVEPASPPERQGFKRAVGKTISAAYFGGHTIGVALDEDMYLVSSTAGHILYATWLYEKTGDGHVQAIAKTITGAWRSGGSFGLTSSAEDKRC